MHDFILYKVNYGGDRFSKFGELNAILINILSSLNILLDCWSKFYVAMYWNGTAEVISKLWKMPSLHIHW